MIKKQQYYTVGVRTFNSMFYDSRVLYTVYIAKRKKKKNFRPVHLI